MGRRRGQRNAAREKMWPGAEAAEVRAAKHGAVVQTEESLKKAHGYKVDQEDAGSTPASPAFDVPPSDLAALERRENAEDGRVGRAVHRSARKVKGKRITRRKLPRALSDQPLRKARAEQSATPPTPRVVLRNRLAQEDLEAKRELYHLLSRLYTQSKTDFFKVLAGFNNVEYALPEMWHECDPSELLDLFSCIDWHRMALAIGYKEAEIRKYARA